MLIHNTHNLMTQMVNRAPPILTQRTGTTYHRTVIILHENTKPSKDRPMMSWLVVGLWMAHNLPIESLKKSGEGGGGACAGHESISGLDTFRVWV